MSAKYQSHDERTMVETAMKSGWVRGERNAQTHLVMIHPCGAKYPLPRNAKNKHVLKRIEKQMRMLVQERTQKVA